MLSIVLKMLPRFWNQFNKLHDDTPIMADHNLMIVARGLESHR
jgi:hypothetical protein